jgi:S1-C subfamily serine protease
MDQFGVQIPKLKKLARTPIIPPLVFASGSNKSINKVAWLGADLKNIETMGERSAAGLDETSGVLITNVKPNSLAARGELRAGDVIIECEGKKTKNIAELLNTVQGNNWKGVLKMVVFRNQEQVMLSLKTK